MTVDRSEDYYAALLGDDPEQLYERAPCGYLSTTADGRIIKVNQTFLDLTGYARAELVGRRRFAELLTPGGRLYHETHYAPMLRLQRRVREIALELVGADGRRLPVLVNSVLEVDEHDVPLVVRTAVFDATERRAYEQELMRAKQHAEASEAHATALARTLQRTLLPPSPPRIPGLQVAARYRPAGAGDEVGGDFYDVFAVGRDNWAVFVGDVAGKGVEAATVTSLARYTLRATAVWQERPTAVLLALNDLLRSTPGTRMCSVAFAGLRRLDADWMLTVACAGHPLPVLLRPGRPPANIGRPGTLLGAVATPRAEDVDVRLQAGDTVLLFTDGVPDGRRNGEFYDDGRFAALLARHSAAGADTLADALLDDVLDFQFGVARDDIALVAITVLPAPEPAGAAG